MAAPSARTRAALVALVCVVCAAGGFASASSDYADMDFGVMVDAGSTGSRVHIYSWPRRVFSTVPPPLSRPIAQQGGSKRLAPGISTGAPGLAVLKQLVAFAKQELAPTGRDLSQVPFYLKATAGMRVLTSAARESILKDVREYLATTGFLFKDSWARVISGEEEGIFGWITVNYVNGLLVPADGSAINETLGALDLGGASTQITFKADVDLLSDLYNLQLGSVVNEDLYTHSFLYFGNNEAMRRGKQLAYDTPVTPPVGSTYFSPCYYKGSSIANFTTIQGRSITINGTGDYGACRSLLLNLLDRSALCFTAPNGQIHTQSTCSIAGEYQPPLAGKFIAFSGFAYIYGFLKLQNDASLSQLGTAGTNLCATDWATLQTTYPKVPASYLMGYCFGSAYMHTLLRDGYGVPDNTNYITVVPPSSNVSYALGSMIYEANALGWQFYSTPPSQLYYYLFIGFVCLCGLLAFVLLFMCCTRPKPGVTTERSQPLLQTA